MCPYYIRSNLVCRIVVIKAARCGGWGGGMGPCPPAIWMIYVLRTLNYLNHGFKILD